MGKFEGFYTEEINEDSSISSPSGDIFSRRRQKREKDEARKAQLDLWSEELDKCSTAYDYAQYTTKYGDKDNPYLATAMDKYDELSFSSSRGIGDYKRYLYNFPQGKHVAEVQERLDKHQLPSSPTSDSGEKIENILKHIIGIIVILLGIGALYLWLIDEVSWKAIAPLFIVVVFPVVNWAFNW